MESRFISVVDLGNGDSYEGSVKGKVKQGRGTYKYANGDTYEGEWQNDEPEGHGVYTFANGSYYEGDFVKGQF